LSPLEVEGLTEAEQEITKLAGALTLPSNWEASFIVFSD
jgi:hypothetical protein